MSTSHTNSTITSTVNEMNKPPNKAIPFTAQQFVEAGKLMTEEWYP